MSPRRRHWRVSFVNAESSLPTPRPRSRTRTKICGVRTSAVAIAAARIGADLIGLMLAPSKRQIDLPTIGSIRADLRAWSGAQVDRYVPTLSAVVVNLSVEELQEIASSGVVDVIQLSGDESPEVLEEIEIPIFKAIRIDPQRGESAARREIEAWLDRARPAAGILVDAWHPNAYGGTGLTADWTTVARLAADYPVWLAGGLTPDNVERAIAEVQPYGVDVSSGVETDGQKDVAKIAAFLAAAGTTTRP